MCFLCTKTPQIITNILNLKNNKMKKILLFLCLFVMQNAFAADISGEGISGETTYNPKTQTLNITIPGALANWVKAHTGENYSTNNPYEGLGGSDDFKVLKITGTLSKADLEALNTTTCAGFSRFPRIDMSEVTLAEGVQASDINEMLLSSGSFDHNGTTITGDGPETIILPPACHEYAVASSSWPTALKVGTYDVATKSLSLYTKNAGLLTSLISEMPIYDSNDGNCRINKSLDIDNLKLSGSMNINDIDISNGYWGSTDENGTSLVNSGLCGLRNFGNRSTTGTLDLKQLCFESSKITPPYGPAKTYTEEDCLKYVASSLCSAQGFKTLYLPETTGSDGNHNKTLYENALSEARNLEHLCIPSNYTTIGKNAINGPANLNHIFTNEENGDNGEKSITIASTVTYIGTGAFETVTGVWDVYVLATTAPVCEVNAFSGMTCVANNTFPPGATIDKEITAHDYYKTLDTQVMATLHFPNECSNNGEAWNYTDPTRDFSIATSQRDERGNIIMYPNQAEMNRAWVQATAGYLWGATDNTRNGVAQGQNAFGFINGAGITWDSKDPSYFKTAIQNIVVDASQTYSENYIGWHQFLLTSYGVTGTTDFVYNFNQVWDNEWWTIALPFDMTKDMLYDYFGDRNSGKYPKVCELVGVKRVIDKKIVLQFGEDLVAKAGSDDVVMKKGHAYMIKPNIIIEENPTDERKEELAQMRIMRVPSDAANYSDFVYTQTNLESMYREGAVAMTTSNITYAKMNGNTEVTATVNDDTCPKKPLTYSFVGSYWKYSLPEYCYFLGWNTQNSKVTYFWRHEPVDLTTRSWNTCTAVICPNWNKDAEIRKTAAADNYHWVLDDFSVDDSYKSWLDAETTPSNIEMSFKNDTEGVNLIHLGDGATIVSVSGNIYNLNGQLVSRNGETSNLPKGIYVAGGKKFAVK